MTNTAEPTMYAEALALHRAGFALVPLSGKTPMLDNWAQNPITTETGIHDWWAVERPNAGIGVATGALLNGASFIVIDTDQKDGIDGEEELKDAEEHLGKLPEGPEVLTPTGSVHRYFAIPAGVHISNSTKALRALGVEAVDIRGGGGQVVAPPSAHPAGGRYEWLIGQSVFDIGMPELPAGWVTALNAPPPREYAPEERNELQARLARNWSAWKAFQGGMSNEDVVEMLMGVGWHSPKPLRGGGYSLTRQGKARGIGCTVGIYGNDGYTYVHTSSSKLDDARGYNPAALYSALFHDGDDIAADKAIAAAGWGRESRALTPDQALEAWVETWPERNAPALAAIAEAKAKAEADELKESGQWEAVDFAGIVRTRPTPPPPDILSGPGDHKLFYSGTINALVGESESGKSWIAFLAVLEELRAGRHAVIIDFESDAVSVATRFLALGVTEAEAGRLSYIAPETPCTDAVLAKLATEVLPLGPSVVIFDGITEALTLDGLNAVGGESNQDYPQWLRRAPQMFADAGAAVITIDHAPHNTGGQPRAIGGMQKKATVKGVSYFIEALSLFGQSDGVEESKGLLRASLLKDRPGGVRQFAGSKKNAAVCDFNFTVHIDGLIGVRVTPPREDIGEEGGARGRAYRYIVDTIKEHGPLTRSELKSAELRGNSDEYPGIKPVQEELKAMVENGALLVVELEKPAGLGRKTERLGLNPEFFQNAENSSDRT